MTGNENSAQRQAGRVEERQSSAMARLLPKVTFGLGAAVLAGVVVVTVPVAPSATGVTDHGVTTTSGLGAAINAVIGITPFQTTCCGGRQPATP
jgi:hypothetical protein